MKILGNPLLFSSMNQSDEKVTLDKFSYTGSFQWKDEDHTVLALLSSGVLSFPGDITLQVFLVGGGGGGGAGSNGGGGGGGGGGYTQTSQITLHANEEYTIGVGAGGLPTPWSAPPAPSPTSGGQTTAFDLTANGGGGGFSPLRGVTANGGAGGSGGGGGGDDLLSSQGRPGAGSSNGGAGASGTSGPGGAGQGTTTRAFGDPDGELYAGGGGGGGGAFEDNDGFMVYAIGASGGAGGGGTGGCGRGPISPTSGTVSYGGGGGGGGGVKSMGQNAGASGGSGVILLRVPPAQ